MAKRRMAANQQELTEPSLVSCLAVGQKTMTLDDVSWHCASVWMS